MDSLALCVRKLGVEVIKDDLVEQVGKLVDIGLLYGGLELAVDTRLEC